MKLEKDLLHFGYVNKNGRMYTKDSYDWSKIQNLSKQGMLCGELDQPDRCDVLLSNISHVIKDIEIFEDGVYGEIEILSTPKGNELKTLIDNGIDMVFRPRSTGTVDSNGNVHIDKIYAFDAILASQDSFFNPIIYRRKKLEKLKSIIDDKRRNSQNNL